MRSEHGFELLEHIDTTVFAGHFTISISSDPRYRTHPMPPAITKLGLRFRLLVTRFLQRFGFSENSILLPLALIVGVITAAAAVGFHLLIDAIRDCPLPRRPARISSTARESCCWFSFPRPAGWWWAC